MAKIFGTLVGAPVSSLAATGFGAVSDRYKDGRDQVLWRDSVTLAGNVIGDQISLGLFRSTAYLDQGDSLLWFGACGASCVLNIGDATHATALASGLAVAAAGTSPLQAAWQPLWIGMSLWQRLGWASDPGGTIELLATFAGANPANVSLAWQVSGRNN